ncbi:hypothetical protein K9M78_02780 [Candidatus Bipolaricaulota bacterium]|nr:hypothetical protein [Candidatus Bipolaricaulota bacterium]
MLVEEIFDKFSTDLRTYADSETVFGEAIDLGDAKVVPICKLSVGYGGGGGEGKEPSGKNEGSGGSGSGGGVGGGLSIEPVGVIVSKDGEVSVATIGGKESKLKSLIDMIPETVEKITESRTSGEDKEE